MKSKYIIGIFLIFIVCSIIFAEIGVTNKKIVLGQSAAFEGSASKLGVELNKGANAYFEVINQMGGINGRKIRLISYNDNYEPKDTIANTQKLINQDKVFALFGYVGTPTSKAVAGIVRDASIPFFGAFTGADFLRNVKKNPMGLNVRGSYDDETAELVNYLFRIGKKKIAVFYQNDAYGRVGLSGVLKAMSAKGSNIVSKGKYERNTIAIKEGLTAVKAGNPDAVIMVGAYKACAAFIKAAKSSGMKDVTYCNISFVGSQALADELGTAGVGVLISQVVPFPWDSSLAVVKEYQTAMKDTDISFGSLEGYLDARVLVEILKKAGSNLTREGMIKTAESMGKFDLAGLAMSYGPSDHQAMDRIYLTTIIAGQKFKSIK